MVNKVLVSFSCVVLLASCGSAPVSTNSNTASKTDTVSSNMNTISSATNSSIAKFSAEMVAAHNTSSDCWSIVNGKVYDLTKWEAQHPGGSKEILKGCGKDISKASASHAGGNFASDDIQQILAEYYKGDLE